MEPTRLFENQRHIRSIKLPTDKAHPYSFFNVEAMQTASCTLTGGAFKLYVYFCTYNNQYHEYLGTKRIKDKTGLSEASYHRAFKELEQYKYIQPDPRAQSSNDYIFVESGIVVNKDTCTQNEYTPCTQNDDSK